MEKKYKIIIGIVAVVAVIVSIAAIINRQNGPSGNPPSQTPATSTLPGLPEYTLSGDEEQSMAEFVKTFASLYNTYSKDDLTNFQALGDYQTTSMQDLSAQLMEDLEGTLLEGYEKWTVADKNSFRYSYPSANNITATINVEITETGTQPYKAQATLNLLRFSTRWYVDSILYTTN